MLVSAVFGSFRNGLYDHLAKIIRLLWILRDICMKGGIHGGFYITLEPQYWWL